MMFPSRRAALTLLAALTAGAVVPWPAQGQAPYPNQTIRILVTNPAGGLPDTVARIMAKRLQERMGQTVVVENRPGASGGIAAAALLSAPADGYTFMVTDGAIVAINPLFYAKLGYNPKDLLPVTLVARAPMFLAAHPKVPAKTMKEFIDYAKAHPGQINFGSAGLGSTHHLSMEAVKLGLGLQMTHVPYKGTGEAVPALLGGHVDVLFSAYPSLSGAVGTKLVTLLATNAAQRSSQAPDVPAISEFIPGFDSAPLQGIFARTGTPPAIVQKIASEVAAITKEPKTIKLFTTAGIEAVGAGPEDFQRALDGETARAAVVVKAAGIKAE